MTELITPAAPSSVSRSSSTRSPRRVSTVPLHESSTGESHSRAKKRIIVCCDGTWQDGLSSHRSKYTNVLRLARSINHEDTRKDACQGDDDIPDGGPSRLPIQQIVYYQSGVGTDGSAWSRCLEGATGSSLVEKVENAYAFIAHNYYPGDDIYLFGFSRGAYTVRMVAMFIEEIGILDRRDMDHFAKIFVTFQERGVINDPKKRQSIDDYLAPWLDPQSKGKQRADVDKDGFIIKCIGVWDTVGSLGLPDELLISDPKNTLFGFKDPGKLGAHIHHAFQALALDERRKDFNCNKFEQTEAGRNKKQVLKQCWFAGCHTDVGGGYENHDLSDISLFWMSANIESMLALDPQYLEGLLEPVARWGEQHPHDSATGIFTLASTIKRDVPLKFNEKTCEYIHPSVLERISSYPSLEPVIKNNPELVCELMYLEQQLKTVWNRTYDPEKRRARDYLAKLVKETAQDSGIWGISRISRFFGRTLSRKTTVKSGNGKLLIESTKVDGVAVKAGLPVTETRPIP